MSLKKWNQLAEENSAVDKQTGEIHQKFRMDKINKEFSQLSGEELFKPITKRLDEKSSATTEEEEEEEQEGPDYTMCGSRKHPYPPRKGLEFPGGWGEGAKAQENPEGGVVSIYIIFSRPVPLFLYVKFSVCILLTDPRTQTLILLTAQN